LRCPAYLRYVDDFLLFADDKRQLWTWKVAIRGRLADLRLTVHERESTVYPVATGIPFLEFRIYPDHRRLKRRNGVAFVRRLRGWRRLVAAGKLTQAELTPRVQGLVAHAAHGPVGQIRDSIQGRAQGTSHRLVWPTFFGTSALTILPSSPAPAEHSGADTASSC